MCVSLKHGLIIVSNYKTKQLHMHSLADGALARSIGSKGSGKGQFNFECGGLCVSPDGDSVLVAEWGNNRVQQMRIADGSWVRFIGKGLLKGPQFVDCNSNVIAVSENCYCISVLSWADGSVRAQFGSMGSGPGQMLSLRGVRLLAGGSGLVLADCLNDRVCVFTLSGEVMATVGGQEPGLNRPCDVLECAVDGSFVVANNRDCFKLSRDGVKLGKLGVFDKEGHPSALAASDPTTLAALPDGEILMRGWNGARLSILRDHCHRLQWIGACVSAALV